MAKINKLRAKMELSERAKQFAPFQALGGYYDALRRVEAEVEEKMKEEKEAVYEEKEKGCQ